MNKNDLNSQLKKHLESLQNVPERDLQASHASRENFLTQIKSLKPRPAVQSKPSRRANANGRRTWVSKLAVVAVVLLVALSGLGGTAYAAQASGPDDFLYGVKTLTEDIQVSLESDPQDRLDLYASFASRRLQEIQAQVDAGEPISEKALALLEKHTQKMLEEAAQMGEAGLNNALLQIEQNLQQQNQMMEKMQIKTPGGGAPGLLKAQEKIRERLELVENGLMEPQGFQEQMQMEQSESDNDNGKPDSPGSENGEGMPDSGNGNGPGGK